VNGWRCGLIWRDALGVAKPFYLVIEFIPQFPPQLCRRFGPKQNPKATLTWSGSGAPFIIHSTEPAEAFEELVAKGGLQPGKVLELRRPVTTVTALFAALGAERAPFFFAVAQFDTTAHEVTPLQCQSEVTALSNRRKLTKGTMSLTDHNTIALEVR
jgi:hypothetical protein